ncbi:hypothetical protein [Xanthomonas phage RTH11]|nr:hypothetical protein [Xanthomonas phage RTH11]
MKNLKTHFTAASAQVAMESFDEGASIALDHTEAFAAQYERDEAADGRAIDAAADAVEAGINDVASLESLITAIDEARDVGMEAGSAQFAKLQLSTIQNRYQITGTESAMPSLECFDGRQARLATTVTMESVKETLNKIWEWIKEMGRKFIKMARDAWHRMTKNIDVLLADADKLKKFVQRNKFEGGRQINIGGLANRLSVDGQVPRDCTSALQKLGQLTRVGEETVERVHNEVTAAFERKLKGERADLRREVMIPSTWHQVDPGRYPSLFAQRTGAEIYVSPSLPGEIALLITTFGGEDRTDKATVRNWDGSSTTYTSTVGVMRLEKDRTSPIFETLSSQEVFTLCQRVQKAITAMQSSRRAMDDHFKRVDASIAQLQRKSRDLPEDSDIPAPARLSAWFFKNNTVFGTDLLRAIESQTYSVLRGFLRLGELCVPNELREQKANA